MNFSSLGQRRLSERPRELPLHRRDLSETTKLDGGGIDAACAEERIAATGFKENGDSEKMFCVEGNTLPIKILERELSSTTKRRVQADRAGRGSAAPLLDPRRADGGRAIDRQDRGGAMDSRRLEGKTTLAFERPSSRAERSFAAAGGERDDEREKPQPTEENQDLEQTKEKNMSLESMQEIVAQYKMALADLTVNSKIIITRLTIFAGDNIDAAKGIAATICAHILEVPSEQKLPSLYLLDSIVKNIGRDYIELFAAKLPEVFCEAYRQVDPSLHPKMKRLFETWREVFFGDPLLAIEEQLQFNSASSNQLPAAKTAESPSHRPGHGIHVNPSYVEAQRQRMQQASRPLTGDIPKDSFSDDLGSKTGSADNFLDYDYVCTDIGAKIGDQMQRTKDSWENSWHKEDGSMLRSTDNKFDPSRYSQGNVVDDRQSSPRLLIDAYGNIRVPPVLKSPPAMVPPQRDHSKGRGSVQKSWEEGSHSWDDKVPRSMDNKQQWELSRKAVWFSGKRGRDSPAPIDKAEFRSNPANHDRATWHYDALSHADNQALPDRFNATLERVQEMEVVTNSERDVSAFCSNPGSVLGHQFPADRLLHGSPQHSGSSMQLNLEPFSFNPPNQLPCVQLPPFASPALNGDGSSFGLPQVLLPRPIFNSQSLLPPQVSALQPPRAALVFSSNSLGHGNMPVINHAQLSDFSLPNQAVPMSGRQPLTSFQASQPQSTQVENSSHSQLSLPEHILNSLPALPLPTELLQSLKQLQEHLPGLHNMSAKQCPPFLSEQSGIPHQQQLKQQQQWQHQQQQHEQGLQQLGASQQLGQTSKGDGSQAGAQNINSCNLLAAFLGSVAVSSAESGHLPETCIGSLPKESSNFHVPPMSGGQPQPFFPASGTIALPTQGNHPFVTAPLHTPHPGQVLRPPLPPGPPPLPSQVGNLPSQTLNTNISTLLSSLVAQGLISAASSVPSLPQPYSGPISMMPSNQNMAASEAAARVLSDGVPNSLSNQGFTSTASYDTSMDTKHAASLGFEFKTDVLRERQDFVINALYASLLAQCKTCGLRCESQDALLKHMERHAPQNSTQNFLGKYFRSWFPSTEEWVKGGHLSVSKLAFVERSASKVEDNEEPAVPADEDQAGCTLCGEPFEDFYDDEKDLWMYKGAVYVNTATDMTINEGKGPIVHAKCRSTSDVPCVDVLSVCLLSPNQRQHSLLAFQDEFTGHQHQEAGLELVQTSKRARY